MVREAYVHASYRRQKRSFNSPRAQSLMPDADGVVTLGHILNLERTVGAGDREVWMRHHANVRVHPFVYIALHGNHDFRPREPPFQIGRLRRLLLAPLAI